MIPHVERLLNLPYTIIVIHSGSATQILLFNELYRIFLVIKIEVIESDELINRILPEISSIVTKGLIEVSDTVIIETRG